MFYGICMNLFIWNTFKLYNFMDLFELGYYLYKLFFSLWSKLLRVYDWSLLDSHEFT